MIGPSRGIGKRVIRSSRYVVLLIFKKESHATLGVGGHREEEASGGDQRLTSRQLSRLESELDGARLESEQASSNSLNMEDQLLVMHPSTKVK